MRTKLLPLLSYLIICIFIYSLVINLLSQSLHFFEWKKFINCRKLITLNYKILKFLIKEILALSFKIKIKK